jgi:uroporphyrinogen decarboxylase
VDLLQRLNGSVYIACTPSTAINEALFGYHCGLEILSYLWADEPELVLRWFRAIETAQQRFIELTAHADQAALAVIYSDVAFKGRLMFSLDTFRAWGFFDDVARICAACHRAGLQVIFHSDGYIMDLLPDLVAAGIDGLNPIEKAAGMDLYEIRRLYPQLILAGGLDVTHLLPFGTPEEVRRETRRMINETGSEGRLLIGSSTEVGNDVPLANYLAFRDEVFAG